MKQILEKMVVIEAQGGDGKTYTTSLGPEPHPYKTTANQSHQWVNALQLWKTEAEEPKWEITFSDSKPTSFTGWVYHFATNDKNIKKNKETIQWREKIKQAPEKCLLALHFSSTPINNASPIHILAVEHEGMAVMHVFFPCNPKSGQEASIGSVITTRLFEITDIQLQDMVNAVKASKVFKEWFGVAIDMCKEHYTSFCENSMNDKGNSIISQRFNVLNNNQSPRKSGNSLGN